MFPSLPAMEKRRTKSIPNLLTQFAAVLVAAFFVSPLAAQTVSLDQVAPITLTGSATVSAISIDPGTGNVIVRSSIGNFSQCTAITPTPTITVFTAAASPVLPGGNITLNWASSQTTSCTPSQGQGTQWSTLGTLGTSGSQVFAAPQSNGTITFQLTCTNGTASDTRTTQVTVQGEQSCPPIFAQGALGEFDGTFGNVWPAYNDKVRMTVNNNQYVGLHFTATASPTQFGTISTTGYPGDGDGNGIVSISPTAGCFNASIIGPRCVTAAATYPGVSWTNGQSDFVCKLNPGGGYWVNLYFPDCPSGVCGRDFGNIQQLLITPESIR